jgi:Transposase IS66 family
VTGRIWTYVRDDRPFGGHAPPAALYYASRDRKHEHPVQHLQAFTGILQADAYSGYNELYDPSRSQGAITAALCWAHARRQFFELADIAANARRGKNAAAISPVALAAVKRIDALFDIERDINGLSAEERLRVRQEQSAPILAALEAWLHEQHSRLSCSASVAQPIDYMLKRWALSLAHLAPVQETMLDAWMLALFTVPRDRISLTRERWALSRTLSAESDSVVTRIMADGAMERASHLIIWQRGLFDLERRLEAISNKVDPLESINKICDRRISTLTSWR